MNELWEGTTAFDVFMFFHHGYMAEVAAVFLDHDQDPNKTISVSSPHGIVEIGLPLHTAVLYHDISLARVLLKYGAEINALNSERKTPLDMAFSQVILPGRMPIDCTKDQLRRKRLRIASFLLDRGGRVNCRHTDIPEIADMKFRGLRNPRDCKSPEDFETLVIDSRLFNMPCLDALVPIEPLVSKALKVDTWLPDSSPSNPGVWNRLLGVFTSGFKVY